jgi:four helix bundle protein
MGLLRIWRFINPQGNSGKKIYSLAKQLPEYEKYNLANQMRRAAVSLTNGIAEGHGRFHYQENIQFLRHSRGSLKELIDDINVCIDENYDDSNRLNNLKQEGYELLKKLNGYIKYLRSCKQTAINNNRS